MYCFDLSGYFEKCLYKNNQPNLSQFFRDISEFFGAVTENSQDNCVSDQHDCASDKFYRLVRIVYHYIWSEKFPTKLYLPPDLSINS